MSASPNFLAVTSQTSQIKDSKPAQEAKRSKPQKQDLSSLPPAANSNSSQHVQKRFPISLAGLLPWLTTLLSTASAQEGPLPQTEVSRFNIFDSAYRAVCQCASNLAKIGCSISNIKSAHTIPEGAPIFSGHHCDVYAEEGASSNMTDLLRCVQDKLSADDACEAEKVANIIYFSLVGGTIILTVCFCLRKYIYRFCTRTTEHLELNPNYTPLRAVEMEPPSAPPLRRGSEGEPRLTQEGPYPRSPLPKPEPT